MRVRELLEKLKEYPEEAEVELTEEMTDSRRTSGEEYLFNFDGQTLVIVRDVHMSLIEDTTLTEPARSEEL